MTREYVGDGVHYTRGLPVMEYRVVRAQDVINATGYGGISGESGSELIMAATRYENVEKGRRDEGLRRVRLDRSEIGKKLVA